MEDGGGSRSSDVDTSISRVGGTTFGDGAVVNYSPFEASYSPPRRSGAFWKRRRRRSYVDTSKSEELQRIRALDKRLICVDSATKPYLDFRLGFADAMARSSLILVNRKRLSQRISANLSTLFDPRESGVSASEKKEREDVVNDLNQRCHSCLFERVASEVEKIVMCEETTPLLMRIRWLNGYTSVHRGGKVADVDLVDRAFLFSGSRYVCSKSLFH